MKLGIIGDAHLGATDYSEKRRADFSGAFCRALDTCVANQAEVICLLGDVFDSAVMRRNVDAFAVTLQEIAPALVRLKEKQIPLLAIAGNHEFGRGREAGELRVLEALGYVRVLRNEEVVMNGVGICGIPWQEEVTEVATLATMLARSSSARRRVLLIHNFVHGAAAIPKKLWEVNASVANDFDRVFAGHHHVAEEVGRFVIPGSTEIQNMLDASEKQVVVYDTRTDQSVFYAIPRGRPVLILDYNLTKLSLDELLRNLARDLEARNPTPETFVYVRISGRQSGAPPSRTEVLAVLRKRSLFDRYVDLRYQADVRVGEDVTRGADIGHLLRKRFAAKELPKADEYLEKATAENLWRTIRDRILS